MIKSFDLVRQKKQRKNFFGSKKKVKDFDDDNIVISKLHKTKNNSKYSETSLQRTPSRPQNSVDYREVSAT